MVQSNHDDRPNRVGETVLAPRAHETSTQVQPTTARQLVADKLLWQMLERWKRSSPELDRIQFLKTVPFFNELSHRQLKAVSGIMFERNFETDELIFAEGQPGAALFLILDGKVAIEMFRQRNTTILAILEKGAFLERWHCSTKRHVQPMLAPLSGRTLWHFIGTTSAD